MIESLFRVLSHGKLSILLFHKVPQIASPLVPTEIDLAAFTRVLETAHRLFRIIPLSDGVTALRAGKLPPRAACITFDDGYKDWLPGIVPTLQRLQLHATFYITTGQFHGEPIWSERILHAVSRAPSTLQSLDLSAQGLSCLPLASMDDRRAAIALLDSRLKYMPLMQRARALAQLDQLCGTRSAEVETMPAADLRALHSAGFGIGSHTVAHPILTSCDPEAAYQEIAGAREHLESLIGGRVEGFAYPNGIPGRDFDASHVAMVRRAGYRHAVTTGWGAATSDQSVFQIPRFTPWGPSFAKMAGQLALNLRRRPDHLQDRDEPRQRALMVAFHFPPQSGSSGVLRTTNFVKNLPQLGWRTDVLSAHPRAYEQTRTDLINAVPDSTRVLRSAAVDAARHLSIAGKYPLTLALPDRWSSWWLPGVWTGLRTIRREHTQLLWSTYPIATAHLIAATLARLTRLPWVADFRDPMVTEGYPREPLRLRVVRRLERHVMEHARLCVFTTEGAAAVYRKRYPAAAGKCVVVENGYDEDVFAVEARRLDVPSERLLILHSGLIYPGDRDPSAFFGALQTLFQEGVLQRRNVLVRFRAPVHGDDVLKLAAQHAVGDVVEVAPPIGHDLAIAEMLGADLLLLLQGPTFDAQIPAKAYEYLRALRPVLAAVSRRGNTAKLMAQYRQVYAAEIDSREENLAALRGWLARRGDAEEAADFAANLRQLQPSSRAHQAQLLAQHLFRLMDEAGNQHA